MQTCHLLSLSDDNGCFEALRLHSLWIRSSNVLKTVRYLKAQWINVEKKYSRHSFQKKTDCAFIFVTVMSFENSGMRLYEIQYSWTEGLRGPESIVLFEFLKSIPSDISPLVTAAGQHLHIVRDLTLVSYQRRCLQKNALQKHFTAFLSLSFLAGTIFPRTSEDKSTFMRLTHKINLIRPMSHFNINLSVV